MKHFRVVHLKESNMFWTESNFCVYPFDLTEEFSKFRQDASFKATKRFELLVLFNVLHSLRKMLEEYPTRHPDFRISRFLLEPSDLDPGKSRIVDRPKRSWIDPLSVWRGSDWKR